MANQEPLAAKLTTARENDVTGVTERWDLTCAVRGLAAACTFALRAERGPRRLSIGHFSSRSRGSVSDDGASWRLVRPSRPICPILDCAMALSIVPTLIAVVKMAMMHRMSNRPEPFVITPSTDRSAERRPSRKSLPGRLAKSLNPRSRSCWSGHIPGLLDRTDLRRPERLRAWHRPKRGPGRAWS